MTDTTMTEAVERIAGVLESKAARYGDGVHSFDSVTASTLRALLAERDHLSRCIEQLIIQRDGTAFKDNVIKLVDGEGAQ